MPEGQTIGEVLAAFRQRAGMSLGDVAKEAGYRGRSSVQRFFEPSYNPDFLPMEAAQRLAKAFDGKGSPPISVNEILTLAGVPDDRAGAVFSVKEQLGSIADLPRDVPVYGTALGCEADFNHADGTGSLRVEQAELDTSEVLSFLKRPPALEGRESVYGVYISGASMFPRFNDGEAVFVDPKRPPMIGDDVIVHLIGPDEHDGDRVSAVLIKRLVRRSVGYLELQQFNPPLTFRIDSRTVKSVHRIVPPIELFG